MNELQKSRVNKLMMIVSLSYIGICLLKIAVNSLETKEFSVDLIIVLVCMIVLILGICIKSMIQKFKWIALVVCGIGFLLYMRNGIQVAISALIACCFIIASILYLEKRYLYIAVVVMVGMTAMVSFAAMLYAKNTIPVFRGIRECVGRNSCYYDTEDCWSFKIRKT